MPYILICRYSCTLVHEGLKKYNMCDILTYVPYGSNEGRLGVKKGGLVAKQPSAKLVAAEASSSRSSQSCSFLNELGDPKKLSSVHASC